MHTNQKTPTENVRYEYVYRYTPSYELSAMGYFWVLHSEIITIYPENTLENGEEQNIGLKNRHLTVLDTRNQIMLLYTRTSLCSIKHLFLHIKANVLF